MPSTFIPEEASLAFCFVLVELNRLAVNCCRDSGRIRRQDNDNILMMMMMMM
jgi:hypothetical protein